MTFRAVLPASALVLSTAVFAPPAAAEDNTPRGTYVIVEPPDEPVEAAEISKIIFLNRCAGGCQVSPGASDARTNQSSIVGSAVTLSAFKHGDTVWNEVVDCVREMYLPFDVTVTDVDPGPDVFQHEAMVAGTAVEAGLDPGILGIAPLAGDCRAINNVISFSFANAHGANALAICDTVAQESAHAFGLDHEFDCSDPMTYLPGCGRKFFRDKAVPCGEFEARTCSCGGTLQNSHRKILSVFGKGQDPAAPVPTIQLPDDGAMVDSGFAIYAFATDVRGIGRVEFRLNGWKWDDQEGHSPGQADNAYIYATPGTDENGMEPLPDGMIDIEIRAFNDLGVQGSTTITVQKGEPCTSEATCLDGQLCADGRCFWEPPVGELGDECIRNQDCISDLCAGSGDTQICTESCIPNIADQCDEDFECISAGGANGVCWPAGGGGGGCCSVGRDSRAPWTQLGFALLVLGIVVRRRRR